MSDGDFLAVTHTPLTPMMIKLRTPLAFVMAAAVTTLCAQEKPTSQYSIDALVATALANNAELKAYEAEVVSAEGQRTQAGFFKNPEVSVEFGGREVRDSDNILQGNGTTLSLSITQTFEFPGKGTLRKAIANKNIEIAELGLEQFRLVLAGQVRLLAYEYLAASTEAEAAESVYQQSRELATQLGKAGNYGARFDIEMRLVQASLVELGAAIKDASQRREETRTQINALLGRPQNLPLRVAASFQSPGQSLNENALIFAAQSNNPLLKIRRSELDRAAKQITATRLDIAPDFAIGPFFSRDVAGDTEQNIGASVSATIPLWDWNIGNIKSAQARATAAEALRVKAERDTEAEILSRLRAYDLTRRQLSQIPDGILDNIQGASKSANTQYLSGSIGAVLYLDAQSAYLNALRTSQNAVLDAWRALLDLNLLTGGRLDASPESNQ